MMNMMNNTGFGPGYGLGLGALWGVHMLAALAVFVGIIFLLLWAAKTLTQQQLKTWGMLLTAIGVLVCLVTMGIAGSFHPRFGIQQNDKRVLQQRTMHDVMDAMMDEDVDEDDAMSMSMEDMSAMLTGKTGDAFDAAFLAGMIPHHQGAIDMANAAKTQAKHAEITAMADAIIAAQQREIEQMQQWQKDWGYTQ